MEICNILDENQPLVQENVQNEESEEEASEWVDEGNEDEEDQISLGLIGKLWSERSLNPTAFMTTIKNVWVTQYDVYINMIGRNLYQFQFYHWRDKEKVLAGQPWHFDKVALLLAETDAARTPSELQIFSLPIWVRIYDIPFRGRNNESNARSLGKKLVLSSKWINLIILGWRNRFKLGLILM